VTLASFVYDPIQTPVPERGVTRGAQALRERIRIAKAVILRYVPIRLEDKA
jgi:hypothetical protein